MSAGSKPTGYLHPQSIKTLKRNGIETSMPKNKSWDEFANQNSVLVITAWDTVASESCSTFLAKNEKIHWYTPDPAAGTGSEEEINAAFDELLNILKLE